jgi:antitoxin component YwqK of YwqJK toxin-antitoxin module
MIFTIIIIFVSCERSGKSNYNNNYYDISDYVVNDTPFDKKHKLFQINDINKYDKTWKFIKSYYPNGNIKSREFSHNNKANGLYVLYYPEKNERIYEKIYVKNNHLNGKGVGFYENGKINSIMYFKMGKNVGTWKTFDSSGHLIDSTIYP